MGNAARAPSLPTARRSCGPAPRPWPRTTEAARLGFPPQPHCGNLLVMRHKIAHPAAGSAGAFSSDLAAALERHASQRTRFAELMILCARIGFNP